MRHHTSCQIKVVWRKEVGQIDLIEACPAEHPALEQVALPCYTDLLDVIGSVRKAGAAARPSSLPVKEKFGLGHDPGR